MPPLRNWEIMARGRVDDGVAGRPLRLPVPEVHAVLTDDGTSVRLTRYRAGDKGPVLVVPGFGTSTLSFTIGTVDENFPEYLAARGYDIWLFDYRASPALPSAGTSFTIDDIALRDYPAAVDTMLAATGADSVQVMAHCVGAMAFSMAMMGGLEGVRSAVLSQLGAHPVSPPANRVKERARLASAVRALGLERMSTDFDPYKVSDRLLDALLARVPSNERCDNPACHRMLLIFGEPFTHHQLNDETHDRIGEVFGTVNMTAFEHLSRMGREGAVVDAHGHDSYRPHADRLAIPITFLHGSENRQFLPESTERTYAWLSERNGPDLYERHLLAGYAHMDCWVGEHAARDVYPVATAALDAAN